MGLYNNSLNSAEQGNETSWYKAFGAGLASGIIKIPEGIVSLGAELIDLGADSDLAADVEEYFDKLNPFEEIAEERTIGKLTEALVQIGVPGGVGFKLANKAARNMTSRALRAKRKNLYADFGRKGTTPDGSRLRTGLNKVNELNKKAKYKRFALAVTGGAAGEGLVVDTDEIGTFGDIFDAPTKLDREKSFGRDEATRKLLNRFKFGSESLLVTPFVFGVGKTAKALAKRGKDLAYSSSKFERWIDKYIRAPFSPRGALPDEVFKSEMLKQGLKVRDSHRATQLVQNITKAIDGIFPVAQEVADKSFKSQKNNFIREVNDILLGGDLGTDIDPTQLRELLSKLGMKNVSKEAQENLISNLNAGRAEFNNLLDILNRHAGGVKKGKDAPEELKELFKKRLEGYTSNTFQIFEHKSNLLNGFRKYQPTDEAYSNAVTVFKMGGRSEQEAREIIDQILLDAQKMKKPSRLPDFKYVAKSMEDGKLKTHEIGLGVKAPGTGAEKKALRELFGEIKDPRFTIFNGMTNLSSLARTTAYLAEIKAKNFDVQANGGRGFFWNSAEEATTKLDAKRLGIEIVPMREVLGEIDATKNIINPLGDTFTTREIAEGIKSANDVMGALQGFVRGDKKGMGGAEKAVSWFYRNLLLFPKGISQMAKTIFSIPTHLRNFFSAGAFTAANGILFEGLSNPNLLRKAFQQGINVSGLLKAGVNSPAAQREYRDMLELGVTNSQVQMGDMISLLKDAKAGETIMNVDGPLKGFFNFFKKVGQFAQGKYMAEDDTFKITNFVMELERIVQRQAKRAGVPVEEFRKTLTQKLGERNPALWQLKKEAAEIVKNTVPNYAYVGEAVKTARLLPIGNFMSFPSEIIRTSTNIAQLGIKEMSHQLGEGAVRIKGSNMTPTVIEILKDGSERVVKNSAMQDGSWGTGFKRIAGMATTLTGVPIAVTEGAKALYDVTEEEIDAMRRFVPEWSKNSTLVPLRLDDGELRYIDFSKSNAYDVMSRPFRTLMNGIQEGQVDGDTLLQGFVNGTVEASSEIMDPFISESIWTEAMADIIVRDGRTEEGRQLYTDQTSAGDRLWIQMMHLGNALAPSYKQGLRIGQAAFGTPDKTGQVLDIGPELAGFMGLRPIKIDPLRTMSFKIAEYQRGIREARREFTGGYFGLLKGGKVTANEIIERYIASNKARFNVQKEMFKNIEAAETLGESRGTLSRAFKERQISPKTFGYLNNGKFDPYYPSEDIIAKFREIARDIGEPSPFLEAGPEVRDIRRDLRGIGFDKRYPGFAEGGHVAGASFQGAIGEAIPVIKQIKNDLQGLSLEDEWDIELADYVDMQEEEIVTPQLPQQVTSAQPNPQTITQGQNILNQGMNAQTNLTQNGLTAAENAYLTEEEKQMKLKQRGMIA